MVKNPPANAGDMRDVGLIPGSGRSLGPGGGNGNPLQFFFFFFFLALVLYICCNECTNVNTILSTKRPTVYIKAPSLCCIILLALEKVSCYVSTMTAPYEIMLMP